MIITYSECVPVTLLIQHTKRIRRIILSFISFPALPYFSTWSHKVHDFRKKKNIFAYKMCFDFLYKLLWNIYRSKNISARHIHKCSCKVSIIILNMLIRFEFTKKYLKKNYSNIKFHENPFSGSRVVPCGWREGHTDGRSQQPLFAVLQTCLNRLKW